METSFPDRYLILVVAIITLMVGCEAKKDYRFDPAMVDTLNTGIDSAFTTINYIKTGDGDYLFCGNNGFYEAYTLLGFDSIPQTFDSIKLNLKADSASARLQFLRIKKQWSEDSLYKWEDLDELVGINSIIDSFMVNNENPVINMGSTLVDSIRDYGLAVHTPSFYTFSSRERNKSQLLVYSGDSLEQVIDCTKDLYILNNPFGSNIIRDTMLIGRGLDISAEAFISIDSSFRNKQNITRAGLVFIYDGSIPFAVIAQDTAGVSHSPRYYEENGINYMEFNLINIFKATHNYMNFYVKIRALARSNGLDRETIEGGSFKLMWVEEIEK